MIHIIVVRIFQQSHPNFLFFLIIIFIFFLDIMIPGINTQIDVVGSFACMHGSHMAAC